MECRYSVPPLGGWAAVVWIALLALLGTPYPLLGAWVIWGHRLREWPRLWQQARQAQSATRKYPVQQRIDTGMRLLTEKKWPEAIDAFDGALDVLGEDPSQEVSLLFYRGFALEQIGELEEAIADYEDCQAIYGRLHKDLQYLAAVRQGLLLAKLGRTHDAEQHLRRTIAALQRAPESVSRLQIEALEILVGLFLGAPYPILGNRARDHARALEYAQEGLRVAHRLRDVAAQASFLRAAGDALQALDRSDEALRSYEQSLDLYRRIGQTGSQATVKRDIALLYQLEGQWDKALAWLQACLVEEERDQNKGGQARLCYDIACIHIDQGNLRDAGRLLQHSISLFRQTENHEGIDRVGRTMMGLSILVHRRLTADQMTFRDVERGSAKSKKEGK